GKYSVGIQTLAYAIEQSIAEGATEFDFLQGDEAYKTHWTTHSRANWQLQLPGPHLRGQLAWARRQVPARAGGWAKRRLPPQWTAALKRFVRRR
ncbi:MAG: GNAT family N-acetyltransferase, partial [Chloroflexi bacterium]|nr:GNAT family N-acetyltransferase [Chloroflexota bacterium]